MVYTFFLRQSNEDLNGYVTAILSKAKSESSMDMQIHTESTQTYNLQYLMDDFLQKLFMFDFLQNLNKALVASHVFVK